MVDWERAIRAFEAAIPALVKELDLLSIAVAGKPVDLVPGMKDLAVSDASGGNLERESCSREPPCKKEQTAGGEHAADPTDERGPCVRFERPCRVRNGKEQMPQSKSPEGEKNKTADQDARFTIGISSGEENLRLRIHWALAGIWPRHLLR
jgi:hypothetical protein